MKHNYVKNDEYAAKISKLLLKNYNNSNKDWTPVSGMTGGNTTAILRMTVSTNPYRTCHVYSIGLPLINWLL